MFLIAKKQISQIITDAQTKIDVSKAGKYEFFRIDYCNPYKKNSLSQWFSTFSVPWPIFQPKLTSQPTLVNKIKFPSQNHSVL